MDILALIVTCAPVISPGLMSGIVTVESHGEPWAIYRQDTRESIHPTSEADAVETARRLVAQKVEIKAGLTQIDSTLWGTLNLTVDNVFSPCANLGAAEDLLLTWYGKDVGDLDAALSRFGTGGDPVAGIKSGYVAQVKEAAKAGPQGDAKGNGDPKATSTVRVGALPADSFQGVPDGFAAGR